MKAIVVYAPGNAEKLLIEERSIPQPKMGEVLIKVRAFGLNRSELMTRKGFSPNVKFPIILGIECVGEVEYDPLGVMAKGQKVLAFMGEMGRQYDGSYAEFAVLPRTIIYSIESDLPWEILGAIPEMFQTVYGSLFTALSIQKGETILLRGGTSSIGLLAGQIANAAGLKVVSTTRNAQKKNFLLENGAADVLIDNGNLYDQIQSDYTSGFDKVLELVGTVTLRDSLKCTKLGGIVCMTGMLSEEWSIADFSPMDFIPAAVHLTIYDSGQIRSSQEVFQKFIESVESGKVRMPIGKIFQLDQIKEAHRAMEENLVNGKIVVLT